MTDRRAALLIGINHYWLQGFDDQPLKYAESDCKKLKSALCCGKYGISEENVFVRTGSGKTPQEQPFKHSFRDNGIFEPFQNTDLDLFFFFFAGHGVEYDGHSYLVPVDGVFDDVPGTCIQLSAILELIMNIPAQRRLLLFDICHGGGIKGNNSGLPPSFGEEANRARGLVILSSCDINEKSHEDDRLSGGVFTYYWIKALKGAVRPLPGSRLTVFDVQTYAEGKVLEWARRNNTVQCPQIWAHSPTIFLTPAEKKHTDGYSTPSFLNDPLSRTETIVRQLRRTIERREPVTPDCYCVRILARFSSFAISKREKWKDNPTLSERLRQERELLIKLFEKGARLKVILSWNLQDYLSLPGMTPAKAKVRMKQLLSFVDMVMGSEQLASRATMIRMPVFERNLMFLNDDYLFEGRHLKIGGTCDATQVITDPDGIQQQIKIYDSLLDSGIHLFSKQRRVKDPKTLKQKLLLELESAIRTDLQQLN